MFFFKVFFKWFYRQEKKVILLQKLCFFFVRTKIYVMNSIIIQEICFFPIYIYAKKLALYANNALLSEFLCEN